MTRDYYYYY